MKGRKVALFVVALLMCGIATLVPLATSFDVTGPDVVLAWDCPNWSMWINAQGEVWVRNGTNINEPATTLRVEVGPSQMGPFTQFGPFTDKGDAPVPIPASILKASTDLNERLPKGSTEH